LEYNVKEKRMNYFCTITLKYKVLLLTSCRLRWHYPFLREHAAKSWLCDQHGHDFRLPWALPKQALKYTPAASGITHFYALHRQKSLKSTTAMTLAKSLVRLALATACLLLIPLVAMQFTSEVVWTLSDFVIAGSLLFGAGLAYVLVARLGNNTSYRLGAGVAVAAGLLLIWVNLAVGFIGSENNPANLLYGGVLAVAFIGALIACFRPQGMANAMFAAALAQFVVPLIAASIWKPGLNLGMVQVLVLNTIFAGLWATSGWLFRRTSGFSSNPSQQLA
jgi:hypothetical protein